MGTSQATSTGRIGSNGYPLTSEQEEILSHEPTAVMKWQAFAGCAKTTTSEEYTRHHTRQQALYLAFNAAIAGDAKGRFPAHVQTQTAHGHAYQALGMNRFRDRIVTKLRPNDLDGCRELLSPVGQMKDFALRQAVLKSLNNFLISDSAVVLEEHLQGFPIQARRMCLPMVTAIVERLMDYEASNLPITHDIYLKAFARGSTISDRFDYLIVDEAQDLNGVLIGMVRKARRPAIIVGDPYQSIYAFRGATNAMSEFTGTTFPLTKSFRFGPRVAEVANTMLRNSLTPPKLPIIGNEKVDSAVIEYKGVVKQRSTIIARTNFRLFEGLVKMQLPFHMVGGIDEMLNQVSAGFALWKGVRPAIIDPALSRFFTWEQLKDASEHEDDPDLVRLVKIIEMYGDAIPDILAGMKARHCPDESQARITLTTAHKAKGREWDHVIVLDDFLPPSQLRGMLTRKRITPREYDQEINLEYVTLTRGRLTMAISQPLFDEVAGGGGLASRIFDVM